MRGCALMTAICSASRRQNLARPREHCGAARERLLGAQPLQ
jgi:hypothetical protein